MPSLSFTVYDTCDSHTGVKGVLGGKVYYNFGSAPTTSSSSSNVAANYSAESSSVSVTYDCSGGDGSNTIYAKYVNSQSKEASTNKTYTCPCIEAGYYKTTGTTSLSIGYAGGSVTSSSWIAYEYWKSGTTCSSRSSTSGITCTQSSPSSPTVTPSINGGTITLTIPENTSTSSRSFTFNVSANNPNLSFSPNTITVSQEGKDNYEVYVGGCSAFNVTQVANGTGYTNVTSYYTLNGGSQVGVAPSATSDNSEFEPEVSHVSGTTYKITVKAKNICSTSTNKTATITVAYSIGNGTDNCSFTVTQLKDNLDYAISISPTSATWGATETATKNFTVSASATWHYNSTAGTTPTWEVDSINGGFTQTNSGNTVTVTPPANSTSAQSGTLKVKLTSGDTSKSASASLSKSANTEYNITISGHSDGNVKCKNAQLSRTISCTYLVNNAGSAQSISADSITYSHTDSTNFTVSATKSLGSIAITVTANNQPSTSSSRSTTVTVSATKGDSASQSFTVTQAADTYSPIYVISASPTSLSWSSTANDSKSVTITNSSYYQWDCNDTKNTSAGTPTVSIINAVASTGWSVSGTGLTRSVTPPADSTSAASGTLTITTTGHKVATVSLSKEAKADTTTIQYTYQIDWEPANLGNVTWSSVTGAYSDYYINVSGKCSISGPVTYTFSFTNMPSYYSGAAGWAQTGYSLTVTGDGSSYKTGVNWTFSDISISNGNFPSKAWMIINNKSVSSILDGSNNAVVTVTTTKSGGTTPSGPITTTKYWVGVKINSLTSSTFYKGVLQTNTISFSYGSSIYNVSVNLGLEGGTILTGGSISADMTEWFGSSMSLGQSAMSIASGHYCIQEITKDIYDSADSNYKNGKTVTLNFRYVTSATGNYQTGSANCDVKLIENR